MPNLRYDLENRNRDLKIFLPDFLPDYLISPQFSIRFSPNSTISEMGI